MEDQTTEKAFRAHLICMALFALFVLTSKGFDEWRMLNLECENRSVRAELEKTKNAMSEIHGFVKCMTTQSIPAVEMEIQKEIQRTNIKR